MKRYLVNRTPAGAAPDWKLASRLTDFVFPWEDRKIPETEFRALWDGTHLHFKFDCVDDDLILAQGNTVKDRVVDSDRVEIFLTPDLTLQPYYCFEMDPRGEVLAYSARHHRRMDWDWKCPSLKVAGKINGRRYQVAGSIPLATLRELKILKPGAKEFHAGVYRAEYSHNRDGTIHNGWMAWVDPKVTKPDFHVPGSFGVFELA